MKTSELTGRALEWAIATCEGWVNLRWHNWGYLIDNEVELVMDHKDGKWKSSLEDMHLLGWNQAGPIIEREEIYVRSTGDAGVWEAMVWDDGDSVSTCGYQHVSQGPTLLVAAMRTFVRSRLGEEVDVPKELL